MCLNFLSILLLLFLTLLSDFSCVLASDKTSPVSLNPLSCTLQLSVFFFLLFLLLFHDHGNLFSLLTFLLSQFILFLVLHELLVLLLILTHKSSLLLTLIIHLLIILFQVALEILLKLVKGGIESIFSLNIAFFDLLVLSLKSCDLLFKVTLFLNMGLLPGLSDFVTSAGKFFFFGGLSVPLILDLLLEVTHLLLALISGLFHVLGEFLKGLMLGSILLFKSLSAIFGNLQLFSN